MNYWIIVLAAGVFGVIVALLLLKRVQRRHAPRTDENEIIIGRDNQEPVVKKGHVDED